MENDISGPGKLIKQGNGTLILSGNNHFAGVEVNQGHLLLTGENHYAKILPLMVVHCFLKEH